MLCQTKVEVKLYNFFRTFLETRFESAVKTKTAQNYK